MFLHENLDLCAYSWATGHGFLQAATSLFFCKVASQFAEESFQTLHHLRPDLTSARQFGQLTANFQQRAIQLTMLTLEMFQIGTAMIHPVHGPLLSITKDCNPRAAARKHQ